MSVGQPLAASVLFKNRHDLREELLSEIVSLCVQNCGRSLSLYLCAAGRVDFVKLELLSTSFLDDDHFLVIQAAGGRAFPAAAEHPGVPLQLEQLVVQALPLHRLLPVEGS